MNEMLHSHHRRDSSCPRFNNSLANPNPSEHLETPLRNLHFSKMSESLSQSYSRSSSLDITKWTLIFDGESSVTILKAAPELLTKDVLQWYRTQQFYSWYYLEHRLK